MVTALAGFVAGMIGDSTFDDCRLDAIAAPEDRLRGFRLWIHQHVAICAASTGLKLVLRRGAVGRKQTQDLSRFREKATVALPAFKRPLDSFILVASNRLVPNLPVRLR